MFSVQKIRSLILIILLFAFSSIILLIVIAIRIILPNGIINHTSKFLRLSFISLAFWGFCYLKQSTIFVTLCFTLQLNKSFVSKRQLGGNLIKFSNSLNCNTPLVNTSEFLLNLLSLIIIFGFLNIHAIFIIELALFALHRLNVFKLHRKLF